MFAIEIKDPQMLNASFGFDINGNQTEKLIPINIECNNGNDNYIAKYSFFENDVFAISSEGEAFFLQGNVKDIAQAQKIALKEFQHECNAVYG